MSLRPALARWLSLVLLILPMTIIPARAADHRDAPFVDGAPEGDITDVFAFVDPNDSSRLVLAMGVNSFAVPSAPGSYSFSPDYLYQFKIDNNGDGVEDHVVQIKFRNVVGGGQAVAVVGPVRPPRPTRPPRSTPPARPTRPAVARPRSRPCVGPGLHSRKKKRPSPAPGR